MAYKIDEKTGLAEVPPGHYWKVSKYGSSTYNFHIRLWRKYWGGLFALPVGHAWDIFKDDLTQDVQRASFEAWRRYQEKVEAREKAKLPTSILGKYPPKSVL